MDGSWLDAVLEDARGFVDSHNSYSSHRTCSGRNFFFVQLSDCVFFAQVWMPKMFSFGGGPEAPSPFFSGCPEAENPVRVLIITKISKNIHACSYGYCVFLFGGGA